MDYNLSLQLATHMAPCSWDRLPSTGPTISSRAVKEPWELTRMILQVQCTRSLADRRIWSNIARPVRNKNMHAVFVSDLLQKSGILDRKFYFEQCFGEDADDCIWFAQESNPFTITSRTDHVQGFRIFAVRDKWSIVTLTIGMLSRALQNQN